MVCHSLLQWTTFCQTSPQWPDCLGLPHTAWLSFTDLDKTVVLWSDWLVFCDYGFSVSALWCPLSTPTVLLGFLLPWTWVSVHGSSSKAQPLLLTLDEGYLLTATPSDLERGVAPLGPPAPAQQLLLGGGVVPLCCCPLPRTWGNSCWLWLLRCHSLALSVTTPDLGRGVASHGHTSVWSVAAGTLQKQKTYI